MPVKPVDRSLGVEHSTVRLGCSHRPAGTFDRSWRRTAELRTKSDRRCLMNQAERATEQDSFPI